MHPLVAALTPTNTPHAVFSGARGDKAAWAGRALGSADALAKLGVQQGHLTHMPSHIYVR
jgi:hypothetical protein